MATLKVKNLKQVQSSIRKRITKELRSSEIRKGVGEIVVDQIQDEPSFLTSEATYNRRVWLEKGNKTSKRYSRELINMTFTGDLMKDLGNNVVARFTKGTVSYVIAQSKKFHKKYKNPQGRAVKGKRQTFQDIQGHLEKLGYDYLVFSDKSKSRVLQFIKEELRKRIGK